MSIVARGQPITLDASFYEFQGGDFIDPTNLIAEVLIVNGSIIVSTGTYPGTVVRNNIGRYHYTFNVSSNAPLGHYKIVWKGYVNSVFTSGEEGFEVIAATPEVPLSKALIQAPSVVGNMSESALYRTLGMGLTDRIFLLGHADGLLINDPLQVVNMQEAINILGADSSSPLLRGLLEVYNAGARDIYLVAVAPMSEYEPDVTQRLTASLELGGLNYYQKYKSRLDDTYSALIDWDTPEIIVPLEAPFYDTGNVDFLLPLGNYCIESFTKTGSPRIGIIGTRIADWTAQDVTTMAADARASGLDTHAGKFVLTVIGEGTFILPQMPNSYVGSLAAVTAAVLATSPMNRGLTHRQLPNVVSFVGRDFTSAEITTLTEKRLNPAIRTKRGKRGRPFQIVLATDNTLAPEGSDYWSVLQMRLVSKCMQDVRGMGNRYLGTIGFPQFQREVEEYLMDLSTSDLIRGFKLNMTRDDLDPYKALVDIDLQPFFGVRSLFFSVEVGPGT